MRFALALIFTTYALYAQAVTVGVIAAVPVTDTFDTGFIYRGTFTPKTIRYQVGPAIDFRLPGSFRIEINALYQPFSFTESTFIAPGFQGREPGNLWQFPAVVKFRIPTRLLKPFIEAGPSVQIATNISETGIYYSYIPPRTLVTHPDPTNRAVAGIVLGGGIDFRLGHFLISPQARYTRWISGNFDFSQEPSSYVGSHLNQIQVLLSIRAIVRKTESK
jgi:hypothetical protein